MSAPIRDVIARAINAKPKWDRSEYIGASEITRCPLDLFWSKTEDDGFRGNGKTERGHAVEIALIRLLKKGGMDIRYHDGHVDHQKELVLDGYPLRSHPDGVIYEKGKPVAALEIKSVGSEAYRRILGAKYSWVVQARLNAYLLGVPEAVLVAVNASDLEEVKEWRFDAMSKGEAEAFGAKAKAIFDRIEIMLEPEAEPSAENCKYCAWQNRCEAQWIPSEEEKQRVEEVDDAIEPLEALVKAKELKAQAKELESYAKPALLNIAKEHEAAQIKAGNWIAIVEPRKGAVRLDTKRLKAEHPEIDYTKYEKRSADTVALKIKEIDND